MPSAQSEPSMDEILASIRRIISEEDGVQRQAKPAAKMDPLQLDDDAAVEDEITSDDFLSRQEEEIAEDTTIDDILVQKKAPETAPVDDEPMSIEAALDAAMEEKNVTPFRGKEQEREAVPEMPTPTLEEAPMSQQAKADITRNTQAEETYTTSTDKPDLDDDLVSAISASAAAEAFGALEHNVRLSNGSGRTIEDLVQAMLRPMLKEWLDTNLPRIVEEKVEEEVRRIARRR